MEIKYTKAEDYLLPNITLPPASDRPIGKYGILHREHLKKRYNMLLLKCRLNDYLADIDEQARWQIKQAMSLAEKFSSDKNIGSAVWAVYTNNAKHSAEGIVFKDLFYT